MLGGDGLVFLQFPSVFAHSDIGVDTCIVNIRVQVQVIGESLLPVEARKDVSPPYIHVVSVLARNACAFPVIHGKRFVSISYDVGSGVNVKRQPAVLLE